MGVHLVAILAGWCLLSLLMALVIGRALHRLSALDMRMPGSLRSRRVRPRSVRPTGQGGVRLWVISRRQLAGGARLSVAPGVLAV